MSSKIVLSLTLELFNFRMDSCDHFVQNDRFKLVLFSCPVMSNSLQPHEQGGTPGLPVPHHLSKLAQVHVHCISDAIQSSHPLTPSSLSTLNLAQHQGLFQ